VRLLLDTHVIIWLAVEPELIPPAILAEIADPANEVFASVASIWELAIKESLRKKSGMPPMTSLQALEFLRDAGIELLPITERHAVAVADLPPIHADPFDRMLVAQALTEPLRLVSHDRNVAAYNPSTITW
jgi:PIN domain nuclease of toxin-antitoxin system